MAEALEFGHGTLHLLAGGVGGGANTLHAESEVVRIRRAQERFLQSDEIARIEVEERLIERLHAVLAGASGDGVANHTRLVGVDDAIANVARGNHYLDGRNAAHSVASAHEALADDGLQCGREL